MSAADPQTVAELADLIARDAAGPARPVMLIDGGSGSGKSTLGTLVADRLGAHLIRMDHIYPGWDGLDAASATVVAHVLGDGRWRAWDWDRDQPAGWVELDAPGPLVIEGSGSLSRAARALATHAVWLDLDPAERRRRAIERDGERYAPHWERWAAQEQAFFDRERPDLLADRTVDVSRIAI